MNADGVAAHVRIGQRQELVFRETAAPILAYDGYHVAIYIANFSGPHEWLDTHRHSRVSGSTIFSKRYW